MTVDTNITFYENVEIENIQDLYSPEIKSNIEKDVIKTYSLADTFQGVVEFNDEVVLSSEMPINQILLVKSKALITSSEIEQNSIRFDGVLKAEFIVSEVEIIEKFEKEIPFSYTLNISDMDQELSDLATTVDSLQANLRGNCIEVDGRISIKGNLFKKIKLNLVKAINRVEVNEAEEVGEFYTVKAHYKQPRETLWEIAKANGTTIDKILSDNNIEGEEVVTDYMPLVILK